MRLAPEQLKAFDDEGYFVLPDRFGADEVAALRHEAEPEPVADDALSSSGCGGGKGWGGCGIRGETGGGR